MSVFISHSFKDAARFDDLCHALEKEQIKYWDPKEMRAGTSLREQLRAAIENCDLCTFIATRNSVQSDWCSAELGAFWGSQKRVIVYVADDSLTDDDVPQQFKGDIWHRKIRDVVRDVKELLKDANERRQVEKQHEKSPTRVADISVGALLDLLRTVLSEGSSTSTLSETMDRLQILVSSKTRKGGLESNPDFVAAVQPYLGRLIGEPIESLRTKGNHILDESVDLLKPSSIAYDGVPIAQLALARLRRRRWLIPAQGITLGNSTS